MVDFAEEESTPGIREGRDHVTQELIEKARRFQEGNKRVGEFESS